MYQSNSHSLSTPFITRQSPMLIDIDLEKNPPSLNIARRDEGLLELPDGQHGVVSCLSTRVSQTMKRSLKGPRRKNKK